MRDMAVTTHSRTLNIHSYLKDYVLEESRDLFQKIECKAMTKTENVANGAQSVYKYTNEFWTSRQRQASSLHEIAYRACFKPQLPRFFILQLSREGDFIYDPFSGRGTTAIEAAILGRNVIANDVNPLSAILAAPRLAIPDITKVNERLSRIPKRKRKRSEFDLSMFYHRETEAEILGLKEYLNDRKQEGKEDQVDAWIRMVATNRLTGHSSGFFSVYTLPPNQAVTPESQKKINEKLGQKPEYRDIRTIILKKTRRLLSDIDENTRELINARGRESQFLTQDARYTSEVRDNLIQLTVTSPPFLNVVQYSDDNWLRCWFNCIDAESIKKKITVSQRLSDWCEVMQEVFTELYRITRPEGWVAFEVGEIRNGKVRLDESVIPLGTSAGFTCEGIVINEQHFTKTSNIWGIKNNQKGTNSNRIVLFRKA